MAILSPDDPLYQLMDEEQRRREAMDMAAAGSDPNIPDNLGSYRGRQIQSTDPNFRERQEALTQLRNEQLARMQGLSDATRGDSLRALNLAGQNATAGGVLLNALPDANPYLGVYNKDYDRNLGLANARIQGAENDENRVSSFIRNAYNDTKNEENVDYSRSQDAIKNKREDEQMAMQRDRFGFEKEKFGWEKQKFEAGMKPELVGVTADGSQTIWRDPKSGEYVTGSGQVANPGDLASVRPIGTKNKEYTSEIIYDADGNAYERVFDKSTGQSSVRPVGGGSATTGTNTGTGPKFMDKATLKEKEKEARLSDKQLEGITAFDQTLSALDEVEKAKKGVDTGPIAGRFNELGQDLGFGDYIPGQSEVTAMSAKVRAAQSAYQKALSGLTVSDREREYLMKQMPQMNDNDATFNAKLQAMRDLVKRQKATELENLKKQGKNTGKYEDGVTSTGSKNVDALNKARDAIARGADRNAVIQRLRDAGIDPSGL